MISTKTIGNPGSGLAFTETDILMRYVASGNPPALQGEVFELSLLGLGLQAEQPGYELGQWANVRRIVAGTARPRFSVFCLGLSRVESGTLGYFRFRGMMGTTAAGLAATQQAPTGALANINSAVNAHEPLCVVASTNQLVPETDLIAGQEDFKCVAILLNGQAIGGVRPVPVLFNGIEGWGVTQV